MATLGVVSPIGMEAGDGFVDRNLCPQIRQHRRITHTIAGDFNRADFQRLRVDAQMHLAPLSTVLGAMFFSFPLAFAEELVAGTVGQ